jgi:maltose-binding protein MalE
MGRIPSASGVNLTNPADGALVMQAMSALANGVPYPQSPYLSVYEVQINIALQSIFQGSSPSAALQAAQAAIQEEILSMQTAVTPTP